MVGRIIVKYGTFSGQNDNRTVQVDVNHDDTPM